MIAVLTLLAALVGAVNSEHYHIIPVDSTTLCQCDYPNGTCLTLDQLSSQISHIGNITISFLPGEHLLTWNMTFISRKNITLISEQLDNLSNRAPRISCVPNTVINITDTDTFTLQGLVIYGCNRYDDGGVISLLRTTAAVIKNTVFQNNSIMCHARYCAAAALTIEDSAVTIDSCVFEYNTADRHRTGAVANRKGTPHIMNSIIHNKVDNEDVRVHAAYAVVQITNSTFEHNNGTAVYTDKGSMLHAINSTFKHNTADYVGVLKMYDGTVSDTVFKHNTGGALSIAGSVQITNSTFEHNTAAAGGCGGAVKVFVNDVTMYITNSTFSDNEATQGGAICLFEHNEITLDSITMSNNRATVHGGAVYLQQKNTLNINGDVTITNNSATRAGGGIYSLSSTINLNYGNMQILNNIVKQDGGGVHLTDSSIAISDPVTLIIDSNTAQNYGGGLYLQDRSQLIFFSNYIPASTTTTQLTNNTAVRGGAIYVSDSGSGQLQCGEFDTISHDERRCFILPFYPLIWAYFTNNSATERGSDIYGGLLDRCTARRNGFIKGIDFLLQATQFSWAPGGFVQNKDRLHNHISSDPVSVCFCQNDVVNCSYTHPTVFKKKGETFTLSVAAVDQVGKPVNAKLISLLPWTENGRLKEGQQLRQVEDQCTELEYNVYSRDSTALLQIYADGPCGNQGISKQDITIIFQLCKCPIGLDKTQGSIDCSCDCAKELKPYTSNCSPQNKTIQINHNIWIEHINHTNYTKHFVTQTCPFDYCVQKPVNVSLTNQTEADKQCAFNRTGRLCGQCEQGLSLVFASSRCQHCSNYYLFLLLPFALTGIALVAFILLLNITVATGTIHGLIFYANILAANRSIFLPFKTENFLTVFISWVNLDLGIEMCFYNGMDSYGKFLLQLVFPAYVFLLIAIIMVLCNRSQRIAGLFGKKNPEATLYTLILLSYSKLIRIIITALQFTEMDYPDGHKVFWLFDANIPYFATSHIPRFLAAFIITVYGTVYTTLLLFGQLFNRCSGYRLMKWTAHRYYIHFIRAHHAPLSDKHRYWVGLLLLVKSLCYLIATFSPEAVTVLSAAIFVFTLILYKIVNKQIYTKRWIDLLEMIHLLNIFVFALVTYFVSGVGQNQQVLATVSMSVSFIAFLGIVLYHILDTCGVKLSELPNRVLTKLREHQHYQPVAVTEEQLEDDDKLCAQLDEVYNYADNDTDDSVNINHNDPTCYMTPPIIRSAMPANQLREPALDDLIPVQPEDYHIPPAPRPQHREPTFTVIDIRVRETKRT